MSNIKKGVYDFLRGSFLTDESAFKNWRIILFVVGLLLIMISSAHKADKKVIHKTILFSPSAASFDNFKNFEKRGKYFNELIKKYINA